MRRVHALLACCTVALGATLASTGTALAQRCEAPPGTSATEQYCETLPGSAGERSAGSGPRVGKALRRDTARALSRRGADGRGVLALPATQKAARPRKRSKAPEDLSDDPLAAVRSAIESGPGSGPGFLWVLVAAGVGMAGIAWVRYRSGSDS